MQERECVCVRAFVFVRERIGEGMQISRPGGARCLEVCEEYRSAQPQLAVGTEPLVEALATHVKQQPCARISALHSATHTRPRLVHTHVRVHVFRDMHANSNPGEGAHCVCISRSGQAHPAAQRTSSGSVAGRPAARRRAGRIPAAAPGICARGRERGGGSAGNEAADCCGAERRRRAGNVGYCAFSSTCQGWPRQRAAPAQQLRLPKHCDIRAIQ